MSCNLCTILERDEEKIFYLDDNFIICRTKNLKGHKERAMVVSRKHSTDIGYLNQIGIALLKNMVCKIFPYAKKVVIMKPKYATVPEHWHYVVTDLDPSSDDFEQILGTPWIEVIHLEDWR